MIPSSAAGIPIPAFAFYAVGDAGATYEGFGLQLWPHPWRQPDVRLIYALTENPDGETVSFRTVNAPSQAQRCGKLFVQRLLEDGKLQPCADDGSPAIGGSIPPTANPPIVGEPGPELVTPKVKPTPLPPPSTGADPSGDAEPEGAKTEG